MDLRKLPRKTLNSYTKSGKKKGLSFPKAFYHNFNPERNSLKMVKLKRGHLIYSTKAAVSNTIDFCGTRVSTLGFSYGFFSTHHFVFSRNRPVSARSRLRSVFHVSGLRGGDEKRLKINSQRRRRRQSSKWPLDMYISVWLVYCFDSRWYLHFTLRIY